MKCYEIYYRSLSYIGPTPYICVIYLIHFFWLFFFLCRRQCHGSNPVNVQLRLHSSISRGRRKNEENIAEWLVHIGQHVDVHFELGSFTHAHIFNQSDRFTYMYTYIYMLVGLALQQGCWRVHLQFSCSFYSSRQILDDALYYDEKLTISTLWLWYRNEIILYIYYRNDMYYYQVDFRVPVCWNLTWQHMPGHHNCWWWRANNSCCLVCVSCR